MTALCYTQSHSYFSRAETRSDYPSPLWLVIRLLWLHHSSSLMLTFPGVQSSPRLPYSFMTESLLLSLCLGPLIFPPNLTMLTYAVKSQLPRTSLSLLSLLKDSSQASPSTPPLPPLQPLASLLILQINFFYQCSRPIFSITPKSLIFMLQNQVENEYLIKTKVIPSSNSDLILHIL